MKIFDLILAATAFCAALPSSANNGFSSGGPQGGVTNEEWQAFAHRQPYPTKEALLSAARRGQLLWLGDVRSQSPDAEVVPVLNSIAGILATAYATPVPGWLKQNKSAGGVSRDYCDVNSVRYNLLGVIAWSTEPFFREATHSPNSRARPNPNSALSVGPESIEAVCYRMSGGQRVPEAFVQSLRELLAEYAEASEEGVNALRTAVAAKRQSDQDAQVAAEQAREQAKEVSRRKEAEQEAERVRWRQDQERIREQRRERRAAEAAVAKAQKIEAMLARHADRVRETGLSQEFLASTIMVKYLGAWTSVVRVEQLVAILLDRGKFESVGGLKAAGMSGLLLKKRGRPASGMLFRREGGEAFLTALTSEGRVSRFRTPAEESQAATILIVMADVE